MVLLIFNSNLFAPVILNELYGNKENNYLVYVDEPGILKLCLSLKIPNAIIIDFTDEKIGNYRLFNKRRYIINSLAQYSISDIYFYHTEYGGLANWVISKFSKKANIYYCEVYQKMPFPKAINLLGLKTFMRYYLYYNTIVVPLKQSNKKIIPSLSDSFFKKNNVMKKHISSASNILPEVENCLSQYKGDIMLLTGSVVQSGQVLESIYEENINKVINACSGFDIISKCHPRFSDIFGKERELKSIPSYIPANLLLHFFDVYIGYNSTLLVEAAINGKLAISLIDLIPAREEIISKNWHSFFTNRLGGKGIIEYPKTLEELQSLIKNRISSAKTAIL